eukprot:Sdes_comp15914_c0_seq1m5044
MKPIERESQAEDAVIIIGAGLSGLSAAKVLSENEAFQGKRFRILEARSRVGGRTLSEYVSETGTFIDLGGQWIGPHQDHIEKLASEFNIRQFDQFCAGKKVLDFHQGVSTYCSDIPSFSGNILRDIFKLFDLNSSMKKFIKLCQSIHVEAPHLTPNAQELDSTTIETWKQKNIQCKDVKLLIDILVKVVLGCEPKDTSMLHFLTFCASSGGLEPVINVRNGHQERMFLKGSQTISEEISKAFRDKITFNRQVHRIIQNQDATLLVEAHDPTNPASSELYRASYVVIAMAPCIANQITFVPQLPLNKRQMLGRNVMGSLVKVNLLFRDPFWRNLGFSGEVMSDTESGPLFICYDCSRPTESTGRIQPGLVAFVGGKQAHHWHDWTPSQKEKACLSQISKWFFTDAHHFTGAIHPQVQSSLVYFCDQNWLIDPWAGGCPVSNWNPGFYTSECAQQTDAAAKNVLRQATGRIHWAGTETALKNQGFMDGAVESGIRVAHEILARI